MSATKRGATRVANDYYPTPGWCVRRMLERIALDLSDLRILEPFAGDGAIVRELVAAGATDISTVEIQAQVASAIPVAQGVCSYVEDFFDLKGLRPFDLIISNPPFSVAEQAIEHAIGLLAPGGVLAFLLRINFLGGASRAEFHQILQPGVFVLPNRPGFHENLSQTDSIEYAWFVYGADLHGRVEVLDATPLAERKRDHEILNANRVRL